MKKSKRAAKRSLPKSMEEALDEAERYFENAKETLKKSPIEFGVYTKSKHVKEASAMGYLATLRAIDSYLLARGIKSEELPTSIEEYEKALREIPHNGKLMAALTVVYQNLHILAYYRSGVDVDMIKSGFMRAKEIIETFSKLNERKEMK
jgi:tetratricopeptide (TPR) repeat protein